MARTPTRLLQDMGWGVIDTDAGLAFAVTWGNFALNATFDGVSIPRPGEPVQLTLLAGDRGQVFGGEVTWEDFIHRSPESWVIDAAWRAIDAAHGQGVVWPGEVTA